MINEKLYDDGEHSWYVFARDPQKPDEVIDTNEYAIVNNDDVMLLDPGGTEIFPTTLSAITEIVDLSKVSKFLCSHQDPDIMSSLPLWIALCPKANVYLSWVWSSFVAHFGKECVKNFITVPDEEIQIELGNKKLTLIPAHYCHSSGNLNLYDETSGILFSGDVGAGLVERGADLFVQDFDEHIKYMHKFHERWMPSNSAKNKWVRRVRQLKPKMICPQHGSIFQGEMVGKFLDWLEEIEVGRY